MWGWENWFYCCCLGPLLEALVLEIKLNIDVCFLPVEGIELGFDLFLEASAVLGGSGGTLALGSSFSLLSFDFDFALSLKVFSFVMPPVSPCLQYAYNTTKGVQRPQNVLT